jgi:hypothetical protein
MLLSRSYVLLPLSLWVFLLADRDTTVASALQQPSRGQQVQRANLLPSSQGDASAPFVVCDRRSALVATGVLMLTTTLLSIPQIAQARAPGSKDLSEAVQQIRDASIDLRKLERDWDQFALIDQEGRAVTDATVVARRVLGGVAPLAGASAIEVAKSTPLYRIDGAFNVIRKACLESESDSDWSSTLDQEAFEELAERILFQVQKADGDLYSVAFASKGTTQISGIYKEAKGQIDQGIVDLEKMIRLLSNAGAPGI